MNEELVSLDVDGIGGWVAFVEWRDCGRTVFDPVSDVRRGLFTVVDTRLVDEWRDLNHGKN